MTEFLASVRHPALLEDPSLRSDESTLAEGSLMRNLPAALVAETRLALEVLVFSADLLNAAHAAIERVLTAIAHVPDAPVSRGQRSEVFASSWAAVDAIYVCRKAIRRYAGRHPGPESANWLAMSEPAAVMRNKFKHLDDNLSNVASIARKSSPLFGAVTLLRPCQQEESGDCKIDLVSVAAGGRPAGTHWHTPPIDSLNIPDRSAVWVSAFDQELDLTLTKETLNRLLHGYASDLERDLFRQLGEVELTPAEFSEALANSSREHLIVATVCVVSAKSEP